MTKKHLLYSRLRSIGGGVSSEEEEEERDRVPTVDRERKVLTIQRRTRPCVRVREEGDTDCCCC